MIIYILEHSWMFVVINDLVKMPCIIWKYKKFKFHTVLGLQRKLNWKLSLEHTEPKIAAVESWNEISNPQIRYSKSNFYIAYFKTKNEYQPTLREYLLFSSSFIHIFIKRPLSGPFSKAASYYFVNAFTPMAPQLLTVMPIDH